MNSDSRVQEVFRDSGPSESQRAAALNALDAAMVAEEMSVAPQRRRKGRSLAITVTAVAAAVAIFFVALPALTRSNTSSAGRDILLIAAKVRGNEMKPGQGQYLRQRTISRALTTNGHDYFNEFTISDTWTDTDGVGSTLSRIAHTKPLGSPLPTDINSPDLSQTSPVSPLGSFLDERLPLQMSGDTKANRKAIDDEVSRRMDGVDTDVLYERWWVISHLLTDVRLGADARSSVFEIAADLGGLRAKEHVTDALGRPASEVSTRCEIGLECSLLFDVSTASVLELRETVVDSAERGPLGSVKHSTVYMTPELVDSIPADIESNAPDLNVRTPAPAPDQVPKLAWQPDGATTETDPSKARLMLELSSPDGRRNFKLWQSPEVGQYEQPGSTCITMTSNTEWFPQPRCAVLGYAGDQFTFDTGAVFTAANGEQKSVVGGFIPNTARVEVTYGSSQTAEVLVKDGAYIYIKDGDVSTGMGDWTTTVYDASGNEIAKNVRPKN